MTTGARFSSHHCKTPSMVLRTRAMAPVGNAPDHENDTDSVEVVAAVQEEVVDEDPTAVNVTTVASIGNTMVETILPIAKGVVVVSGIIVGRTSTMKSGTSIVNQSRPDLPMAEVNLDPQDLEEERS
jgi:hypothetical protein